jgi:hypothetical protein
LEIGFADAIVVEPSGPKPRGDRMASTITFKLVTADGAPADPSTFDTVAPLWRPGDTIPLGARTLRVVEVRDGNVDVDRDAVLVVEDVSE